MSSRVVKVIYSTEGRRGDGTEANPHRVLLRLYSLTGELICELDAWDGTTVPPKVFERGFNAIGASSHT